MISYNDTDKLPPQLRSVMQSQALASGSGSFTHIATVAQSPKVCHTLNLLSGSRCPGCRRCGGNKLL